MKRIHCVTSGVLFLLMMVIPILALVPNASTQTGPPYWTKTGRFGGAGDDGGSAIKADAQGNLYTTGWFSSSTKFGAKTLVSFGDTDMYLAKFAPSGNLLWVVQAGGGGADYGYDVVPDKLGNVYITGRFTDRATFLSVDGQSKTVTGAGWTIFLGKYSSSGHLLWVQTGVVPTGGGNNEGLGVAINPVTGNVVMTGRAQNWGANVSFSSADGTVHDLPGPNAWHMFLVQYNPQGNFQWGEWNESGPNSIPNSVAVDSAGGIYVTGWFEGTVTFYSHDGKNQSIQGMSGPVQSWPDYPDDAFLVKYDSSGNLKWINDVGGYKAIGQDVAVSPDGQVAISGLIGNINYGSQAQAETIVTSQPPGTNVNLGGGHFTNPYNPDVLVATYNSAGVLDKALRFGGPGQDSGTGIAYDSQSNLYVAGLFGGTVNFGGQVLAGAQQNNLFVLESGGSAVAWARMAKGVFVYNGRIPRLAVAPGNKIMVTGPFQGTTSFDAAIVHSAGLDDIFLAQLSDLNGTCITVNGSPNSAPLNQPVTFTATLYPHDKTQSVTGTVIFKDGATTLGTAPISNNHATITTSALAVGTHNIVAYYPGSPLFAPVAASVQEVITQ